ncbi:hypothetical protein KBC03_04855 [Patescibacteria group bacterium]|nr:hypothetical protein [Patescibacteria group bacterium]
MDALWEQLEQRESKKKKDKELIRFGSYLPDYQTAVKTASFANNLQKALDGVPEFDKKAVMAAFNKLVTDEYMTAEEEQLLMEFTGSRQTNRFVKYNIEEHIWEVIKLHEMHIATLEKILEQDENNTNNVNDRIGAVMNRSHSQFSHTGLSKFAGEQDSRTYFNELEAKHPTKELSFTSHQMSEFKISDTREIMQKKKYYAQKKMQFHQDLVNCLRNLIAKPGSMHTEVFKDDTAGSLFTLRRLINLHQATHEMKKWKDHSSRKSKNIKVVSENGNTLRIKRNDDHFDFKISPPVRLLKEVSSSEVFLSKVPLYNTLIVDTP